MLALALRAGVVLATPGWEPINDAADYARHARSIAAGKGYPPTAVPGGGPTALRPPAYPYLLGGVFAVSTDNVEAGRFLQVLLGVAAVALAGLIALRVWGAAAGVLTLALAAVYPPLIVGTAALAVEPLFLVLELGAVAAILAFRRGERPAWAVAAGILAGLAILTRSNGAVLVLPLALAAWGHPRRSWRAARMPALVVACAALTVAPWTLRNALTFDRLIPVSTQDGFTLSGTYNATSDGDVRYPAAWRPANADPHYARLIERHSDSSEPELNDVLRSAALRYAGDHPGYLAKVAWHNSLRLLSLGGREFNEAVTGADLGLGPRWRGALDYGFAPFALLAVAGCLTAAARRAPPWLWLVPVLMLAGVVLINASPRFRAPADPFVAMLAALAISAGLARLRGRPDRSTRSVALARPPRR